MSTIEGKHGDLDYLWSIIKNLPSGTELAIGTDTKKLKVAHNSRNRNGCSEQIGKIP